MAWLSTGPLGAQQVCALDLGVFMAQWSGGRAVSYGSLQWLKLAARRRVADPLRYKAGVLIAQVGAIGLDFDQVRISTPQKRAGRPRVLGRALEHTRKRTQRHAAT